MPNEMKEMRVAILIDAENVAPKYISIILNEANNLGNIIIKRIYGDWTSQQMASWRNTILDNSVQPIQQYSNVSGKNSSDSALIIDAMDLLYSHRLDCFCIVSSDSDFTRLAARLRESEMYVLGMGEQKTPQRPELPLQEVRPLCRVPGAFRDPQGIAERVLPAEIGEMTE